MQDIEKLPTSPGFNVGINARKLKPGTKLEVRTVNTTYHLEILDYGGSVVVCGGKYAKTPTKGRLVGSTWGGAALRLGWIGPGMNMEFRFPHLANPWTTTQVRTVTVVGKGYEFDLDWDKK